jgi:hypothetical protein
MKKYTEPILELLRFDEEDIVLESKMTYSQDQLTGYLHEDDSVTGVAGVDVRKLTVNVISN